MPSVAFFVALGLFQVAWAVACAVLPTSRWLLLGGAAVNLAALATWAVSRTVGMPFGPHRGEAEPLARADALAALLGLAVVAGAVASVLGWRPLTHPAVGRPALTTSAGGTVIAALAVVALTGVSGHAHEASAGQGDHDHGATVATVTEPTRPSISTVATAACKSSPVVRGGATTVKAKKAQTAKDRAAAAKRQAAAAKCRSAALAAAGVKISTPPVSKSKAKAVAPKSVAPKPAVPHDDSDGHTH